MSAATWSLPRVHTRLCVDVIEIVGNAAGLILRRTWADHEDVRRSCAERNLPLPTISDQASWSSVLAVMGSALESAHASVGHGPADHVYTDLFDMADKISALNDDVTNWAIVLIAHARAAFFM